MAELNLTVQALIERETEYTSERARLSAEVARLERDLAGMQRDRAEEDRHLRAAAVGSQAAAERAESRYPPSLLECLLHATCQTCIQRTLCSEGGSP